MSLFQKSVINKYLKNLDNEKVSNAFENFQKFYGDKLRLHNIMQLKEENYQEGFLREIFVETLGYTINPDNDFNLTTEFKNLNDARKADGAILRDGKAIGVIELKSTKTKHLESIKKQAFSYKNNQPGCRYVITSNFQSLRFYIDDATEFEEFNLFELANSSKTDGLTRRFRLLYLLLSQESIFSDLPEKLKQETKFHENDISAQLYNDYKQFKNKIFENLVKNNPQYDKLTLFKKSQKLLDRFLFVFFAEDSGLIPPNAVSKIVEQWKQYQELDDYKTLYSRFQKLFGHLDKGHIYKQWGEIPAYNGGLFRNDELLDSNELVIDDEVLEKDSLTLSAYDFNTEVDVNILGHIFEHSLNEIENITAQLQGEEIDKKKTKRKKDGIFYTPKYITKYIVENTVGTLCKEKKEELQISNILIDESLYNRRVNPSVSQKPSATPKLNKKGKQLFKILNDYKNWLLSLKILDPACGSGAFLNATLDFLIAEHKQADNLIAELTGDALGLFDTDKAILENNIYGVDINEESVEIAKLSMWLRTAQKSRPLSDLSGNIKCGNSLIDNPEVAGDKAFDWHKEFPQIFKKKKKEAWHITFALHNSRYSIDTDGFTRRFAGSTVYTPGFVARTYPELSDKEEIILAEELAKVADEYKLNILQVNICKDHVHALLVCEQNELTKLTGKWKGKTAYNYNRRVNPSIENQQAQYPDGTKQKMWTKSFDKRKITNQQHFTNTINYIKNNRKKHGYPEATDGLTRQLSEMTTTAKHAFRPEYSGGFDVVIGNPPYVDMRSMVSTHIKFFKSHFNTASNRINLFGLFVEKAHLLMKNRSEFGMIIHRNLIRSNEYERCRNLILNETELNSILSFKNGVFDDVTGEMTVLTFSKKANINNNNKVEIFNFDINIDSGVSKSMINQNVFKKCLGKRFNVYLTKEKSFVLDKILINYIYLKEVGYTLQGIIAGDEKKFISTTKHDDKYKPIVRGRNINRFSYFKPYEYIYYVEGTKVLTRSRKKENFEYNSKILTQHVSGGINAYLDTEKLYYMQTINGTIITNINYSTKYILSLLNSKLINFYYDNIFNIGAEFTTAVAIENLDLIPIKKISKETQQPFVGKADLMLSLNKELQNKSEKFIKRIKSNLEVEKLTGKLQNFYNFDFKTFIAELKKQNIKITFKEQDDWEDYFEDYKKEINELQTRISQTDKEIDKMVYELYELTEEEISIVENS